MSMPIDISVIVCTHNRAHSLLKCLHSIEQAFRVVESQYSMEVVVVNNASTDDTSKTLENWKNNKNFAISIIYEPQKGLSHARNAGLNTSHGDFIACIDDDCIMDDQYLQDMMNHFNNDPELCLRGGRVELGDPTDLPLTIKTSNEKKSWKKPMHPLYEGHLLGNAIIGCNFSMQKTVKDKVGLFDTSVGAGTKIPGGEDTDYFYRSYLEEVKIEYVPDMMVRHFHGRKTNEQRKKLLTNYAIGNGALSFKYLFIYPPFAKHIIWQTISSFKRWRRMFEDKNFKPHLHPMRELYNFYKGIFLYIFRWL